MYGQSITGKIVDPALAPVEHVSIGLRPVGADQVTKSTQTDSKGAFQLSPVEPGEYVLIARNTGFQSRVLGVRAVSGREVDTGVLVLRVVGCDSPGVICDTFGTAPPRRPPPPVPVVDLCEALNAPDLYGRNLIVMVGMLTTLHGSPTLTATCKNALSSGGLTWINAVLLPEAAAPQESPTFPNIPELKKKLADRAAALRKASGSRKSRVVAVYGFLDISDGLAVVPCVGDSCSRPDITMPPASFLRVDGFQELK
jgi:hypothetical protein